MRLFAAVDPPAAEVAALAAALPARDDSLRWVPESQWHVTLAFYGEVDDARAETLREVLHRAAARTSPFSLRLAGAGTFPRQDAKARVLWVGLDGDVDAMRRLADRCAGAGRRARIAMEDRVFRPHLTLARARKDPVDARDIVAAMSAYTGEWWRVTSLRLVHSTLGAQVRHETLEELPLTGASYQA